MSLSEGSSVSSSPEAAALAQALAHAGDAADLTTGAPGQGSRIAALAVAMARMADASPRECDALYYAALLRNIGALGKAELSERDVPAHGARICERLAALPAGTADIVRWQAEAWDGTGYPDHLRWGSVPKTAQLLHIATAYVSHADPDEALAAISACSGRTFSPQHVRTFVMWFHTFGGEIEPMEAPYAALDPSKTTAQDVQAMLSSTESRA